MKKLLLLLWVCLLFLISLPAFADNVAVTEGSGKTIGFDDITSVNYQRIKLIYGADGSNSGDVSTSNPFPIQLRTSGGTETGTAGNPLQCSLANTGSNGTSVNVAVTSVVAGTGATSLGKAEDAAHSSGDTAVPVLGVRNDAGSTLAGADGDYIPFSIDANGALRVTGGGGGTEYTEDAAAAANPLGQMLMTRRKDTLSGTEVSADGDNIAVNATSKGEIYVKHTDAIPVTQSGTWNVTNVSGTVSLPTGASTAANQTTIIGHVDGIEGLLGTIDADTGNISTKIDTLAGAVSGTEFQVDVLTMPTVTVNAHAVTNAGTFVVQENGAALTALQLIDDAVQTEDGAHSSGHKGMLSLGVRNDGGSALAGTDGDYIPFSTDSSGALRVTGGGGGTEYTEGDTDATITGSVGLMEGAANAIVPLQGTAADGLLVNLGANNDVTGTVTCNAGTNLNTSALSTSAKQDTIIGHLDGVEALLTTIDADVANIADTVLGTEVQVDVVTLPSVTIGTFPDNEPFNVAQINGVTPLMGAGNTGTGSPRVTIATDQADVAVKLRPQTSGGLDIFRSLDLDETEEEIKATAGQVYGYFLFNASASTRFFKLYNATAASVTVGTTTPVVTIPIPAGSAANVEFSQGVVFGTAITAACTTAVADNDTGAPSANDCVANVFYK